MVAATVLFALLLALEWLFHRSPWAAVFQGWTQALGVWYYAVPFHYLTRLGALGLVLLLWQPELWPLFRGGPSAGWSLLLGLALAAVSGGMLLRQAGQRPRTLWQRARAWHAGSPGRFWAHAAYLTLFPGLVEELLFRWFFTAALWPSLGWWTALAAPLLNLLWHLPVWVALVRGQMETADAQRAMLWSIAAPATLFAAALTVCAALTQNLAGPVLAHAFGDWVGSVLRHNPEEQAAA